LLRIDKDFYVKPPIKHVLTISEDMPEWCLSNSKYPRQKPKPLAKTDIMGNAPQNNSKEVLDRFKFELEVPYQGLRYVKKRFN
jgi:hypothetical protein